jgi:hypothetical protein
MPLLVGSLLVLSANPLAGFSLHANHRKFCDLHAETEIRRPMPGLGHANGLNIGSRRLPDAPHPIPTNP